MRIKNSTKNLVFCPLQEKLDYFFFRAEIGPGGSNDNNDNIFVLKYWAIFFLFCMRFSFLLKNQN